MQVNYWPQVFPYWPTDYWQDVFAPPTVAGTIYGPATVATVYGPAESGTVEGI